VYLRRGANTMTLWHLLVGLCFVMPIGFALQSANASGLGTSGYIYSGALGLLVGLLFAWVMWVFGKAIWTRTGESTPPRRSLYMITTLFAAIGWIALSGMCGEWMSSSMLRIVH